jgi:hypothetical protein
MPVASSTTTTAAGDLATSTLPQQQMNKCVAKVEAADLEVDEYLGGKVLLGLCSLESMLRFLGMRVAFTKDTTQIAHFVLTYNYVTTTEMVMQAMTRLYFDEATAAGTELSRLRIGLMTIIRSWIELNYDSVRNCEAFVSMVMSFVDAADQTIGSQGAAWALFHALHGQAVGSQEVRDISDALRSKESGIHLRVHGRRTHFSGQNLLDWMQDVAGIGRDDAVGVADQLEAAGLIKSAFRTAEFSPAASYYFPEVLAISRGKEVAEALPLLEVSPVELAEQICLREQMLFQAIKLEELRRSVWTKSNKEATSPNVLAMIRFSNKISYWIATEIVSNPNAKKRLEVLRRAIIMANTCLQLSCYNAVQEILCGLQHSSVRKLRQTWTALPFRYREMLHECLSVMSPEENSKAYREVLRARMATLTGASNEVQGITGVVPNLGQYLSDITFIDTANQDIVRGLINFRKMRMIGSVLHELRVFQQSEYQLRHRDELQRILTQSTLCPLSDDDLAVMSKSIESADVQAAVGTLAVTAAVAIGGGAGAGVGAANAPSSGTLQDILETTQPQPQPQKPKGM